jgi:hypothetical protein
VRGLEIRLNAARIYIQSAPWPPLGGPGCRCLCLNDVDVQTVYCRGEPTLDRTFKVSTYKFKILTSCNIAGWSNEATGFI